jgi:hypothetical protein
MAGASAGDHRPNARNLLARTQTKSNCLQCSTMSRKKPQIYTTSTFVLCADHQPSAARKWHRHFFQSTANLRGGTTDPNPLSSLPHTHCHSGKKESSFASKKLFPHLLIQSTGNPLEREQESHPDHAASSIPARQLYHSAA